MHPTAGATIVSAASSGLVAVNVILDSEDIEVARAIAKMMRGPSGGFLNHKGGGILYEGQKEGCCVYEHV